MAEIDKGLPNIKPEDEILEEETLEEVDIADQLGKKPIEVTEEDDGGATIDFDPNQVDIPDGCDHFANLAELISSLSWHSLSNKGTGKILNLSYPSVLP